MILTHQTIWAAIDGLALRYALSPSGLAKRAGLNSTTFNKSKRITTGGRERWPSTESIAKVLDATGAGFDDFIALMAEANPNQNIFSQPLPMTDMHAAASHQVVAEDGTLLDGDFDQINFPDVLDDQAFALEVVEDIYEPVYIAGDILVISPSSEIRRGDRIAVKLKTGHLFLRSVLKATARRVELAKIQNNALYQQVDRESIEWMARIVWAKQ